MMDKKVVLKHIMKSDLTAVEKRYLEKLISADQPSVRMESELKPCPFCGGQAEMIPTWDGLYQAECKNCRCSTESFCKSQLASLRWNKRTRPEPSGWISVKDRLPEDEERILIFVSLAGHERIQLDTCYEDCGYMHLDSGYAFGAEVTHWMPLPELSETKGENHD